MILKNNKWKANISFKRSGKSMKTNIHETDT